METHKHHGAVPGMGSPQEGKRLTDDDRVFTTEEWLRWSVVILSLSIAGEGQETSDEAGG
jgi:hypothetical protein